jgi:Enoyl-CoA hydratase/carnithine racemase
MTDYQTIIVEQRGAVTLVTLNRPQALNALNNAVLDELIAAFATYDADPSQRCLVLTGSDKAFAAGADIKEMSSQGFADMYSGDVFAGWDKITATRKPWLAAVAGYALGGGCEVTMMADFIIAADTRASASRRSTSASCRARAARSACRASRARRRRWTYASPPG